jgi:ATP-dependent Zn protease
MRIEKDLKNTIEEVNLTGGETKNTGFPLKKWVSTYRLNSRQKIKFKHLNLATVLTFFPFALGFSQFLTDKYHSGNTNPFFEKNLPVLKSFRPKLKFETFEYVSKSTLSNDSSFNKENKSTDPFPIPQIHLRDNPFFDEMHRPKRDFRDGSRNQFLFGQPQFLAKIKKPRCFINRNLIGVSCDFYVLPSGNFLSKLSSFETLARNLDELPSYLKGLKGIQEKHSTEPVPIMNGQEVHFLSGKSIFSKTENSPMDSTPPIEPAKSDASPHSKRAFHSLSTTNKLTLVKSLKNKGVVHEISQQHPVLENEFHKNRLCFYKNVEQLNSELQALFLEKNISAALYPKGHFGQDEPEKGVNVTLPYSANTFDPANTFAGKGKEGNHENSPLLEILLKHSSPNSFGDAQLDENFVVESLLKDFEKKALCQDLSGFRLMSGYNYPDMTDVDLHWFYTLNKYSPFGAPSSWSKDLTKKFRMETSTVSSSSQTYLFDVKKLPTFLIETKEVLLRNKDRNKTFYAGPALVLDSQKNLDWKFSGEENLRSWFHNYISPLNPLVQARDNFFGVYSSPEFLTDVKTPDFSSFENPYLYRLNYFKAQNPPIWGPVALSPQSNFEPYNSLLHVAVEEKGKTVLKQGVDVLLFNKEDSSPSYDFLPIVQIQQPRFSNAPSLSPNTLSPPNPFGGKTGAPNGFGKVKGSGNFVGYSPIFDFGVTSTPDYTFSVNSSKNAFLENKAGIFTKKSSGSYRKLASLFSKTKNSTGVLADNWEPLSSRSWLVVTQLSFAVFIFQVLKSLADNYGRELLGYLLDLVSSLGILDDSLKQEIEILMGQREKGFRVIGQSQKNFSDIVGIKGLLPEIYEVVWFLRNSAREFTLSKTVPRGILLTGPPGTGKTLLVQALAGEARVPVVVLSGSSLIEPGESGALKLEMVFQEARQVAPCIVFIDEIDTLAQKRTGVVQNPMGPDELLESLTSFQSATPKSPLQIMRESGENADTGKDREDSNQPHSQQDQLSLLTQFLIELDGIQGRDGVVVIGATNRPEVLDPALLRPGRFDKILQVGLPGQQKRVDILQFYGQGLGYKGNIPWNYLGERTAGFTAADLATLMNESTIKAILTQSTHSIETIEHGINRLTTSESEKYTILKTKTPSSLPSSPNTLGSMHFCEEKENLHSLSIPSKMSILRLAYYQAGKIVLSSLLKTHPKSIVASLWPRRPTIRSVQITTNLQNSVFQFARVGEINDRLVGCYAGKAAEFLFVDNFSSSKSSQISTLGLEDLLFGQKLIYSMQEKWAFFSKKSQIQKTISLPSNINSREFRENLEKLDFYNQYLETVQTPPMRQALEAQTSSLSGNKDSSIASSNSQMYYAIPWWQQEVSSELEFVEKNFTNWSRLYLSNPEQSERNPEWLPPDEFYHSSSGLKNVKLAFANIAKRRAQKELLKKTGQSPNGKRADSSTKEKNTTFPSKSPFLGWNDVTKLTRDYPVHSLVLQSLNKALVILNQNRELLDRIVVELLYNEILRQPEIESLLQDFEQAMSADSTNAFVGEPDQNEIGEFQEKSKHVEILESAWGSRSRKPMPRWIDFASLHRETT